MLGSSRSEAKQMLVLKIATLATAGVLTFAAACSQGTETAPDLGSTVEAAVAATVAAVSLPPPAPTDTNPGQAIPTRIPTATPTPTLTPTNTHTPMPSLTPTPFATSTPTVVSTPDPTLVAYLLSQMPQPTLTPLPTSPRLSLTPVPPSTPTQQPTATPTLRPTATPASTPIPFDIKKANCQHEDLQQETFEFTGSGGPHSWEPWGVREWYRTDWSKAEPGWPNRTRCITLVFHTIEDARWSLNYSTAVQRHWGEAELLEHRQTFAPAISEDTLGIEIEIGQRSQLHGEEFLIEEYVATVVMFRRENIVVIVESGLVVAEADVNPMFRSAVVDTFFRLYGSTPAKIADLVDERLRVELDRISR